jgi:hypothetical protein
MKIDNTYNKASSKGVPVLDAEGYAVCPDCDSRVNCGTIGHERNKFRRGNDVIR